MHVACLSTLLPVNLGHPTGAVSGGYVLASASKLAVSAS
jgi:hypothetical protein